MRLGISPFTTTRVGAQRVSARAVEGGLDTLWLGDGLLVNPDFPGWSGAFEAFTELAWLAGQWPTARVGLTAAVLPLRDIVCLSRQAATLDRLTEGRFILAVAPGFWAKELAWRGVRFEERGARFADALSGLRAALAGEPYEGQYVRIPPGDRLAPEPHTPGGPPIWLAGGDATMRRAIALGLAYQASRITPASLAPVAARWHDAGGGLLAVRVRVEVKPAPPKGGTVAWQGLAGPASFLAEQLCGFADLGVADVSIVPGQDDETSLQTVGVLVDEVLPALRAAGVALD